MVAIGIDPGATGALAIIWPKAVGNPEVYDYNKLALRNIYIGPETIIAIEKVGAMPGQGVVSMFNFGMNFGWWLGGLDTMGLEYKLVTPQRWKKHFSLIGKEKDASRLKAIELFPIMSDQLKLKKHHGRADALLIAQYAIDYYGGKTL